ncbi:MAG: efflux RND transporter permease subunit [Armatimonadota bacterium]
MQLTRLAITRPLVILMFFAALIILGLKSRSGMTVDLYPKIDFPMAYIMTIYPGAGPEEIETLVTKPIEDGVGSVNGMKNLTSSSQEGVSVVNIEFELGTDMITAMADVRSKVDAVRMQLPSDAENPVVQKMDVGALPVIWLGMSSSRPAKELREIADDVIKDRLGKIKGVASVSISGGDKREIQVNVDKNRLEAYGITIGQVAQALSSGNMNIPSGRITEGSRDYAIRAIGEYAEVDEIRNLKLNLSDQVLTIGDIAEVKDTVAEREEITRLQKKDSVGILVLKQSDANTVNVVEGVNKELERMKNVLPRDVNIAVSYDQSERVKESMADVNVSLVLGALLAVLIVFLFLHNIRGTFIVGIAIPTSMIAAFIPISFAGFTMNMMVMLALSLAVGILVDDSIVVLENIYRHLAKGESPAEAAINGRSEIGLAAIAITMVDVVVFVPIAFMGGMVGMFFREFGITVAVATLFSLLVSFTLTPMLASRWYKKGEAMEAKTGFFKKFDEVYHILDRKYRSLLAWALYHRWQVIVGGIATLIIIMVGAGSKVQGEFSPRIDQSQVIVNVEMPAGTAIEATDAVVQQVEDKVINLPDVKNVFTSIGTSSAGAFGSGSQGASYAQVSVALNEKESVADRMLRSIRKGHQKRVKTDEDIAQEIRGLVADIPGGSIKVQISSGMGPGGSPIDIELMGSDADALNAASQKVKSIIAATTGTLNPDVSWKVGKPEVQATIDKLRAAQMDLNTGQISSALRTSIAGSTDTKFRQNGKEYDIRIRLKEFDRYSLDDVGRIVVGSSNGMSTYLQDVAVIDETTGPTKIDRKNRQRKVSVTSDLAPGYRLSSVQSELRKKIDGTDLGDVQVNWGGESADMAEAGGHLVVALLLSIALVYMLMAALFESMLNPLIIMLSLPMALIGAVLAIVLTGETMNIVSMIGIIMLMGLVTKNAILLVDYTNTLRSRGKARNDAILEAGPTRLRPILMTTFAMIFGMLPTAMKLGRGSEMRAPMAIAVIGGLIVSTILTLVMIPVLYTLMDDFVNWVHKMKRKWKDRRILKKGISLPDENTGNGSSDVISPGDTELSKAVEGDAVPN